MFTLCFSKIVVTLLVIVAVWRGYRLLQGLQSRAGAANARSASANRQPPRAQTTDLVECPRCGTFVPNGTICRSVQECQYRRA